jgi:hypothetical protein
MGFVKRIGSVIVLGLLIAGCATNTLEKRKQERAAVYAALPSDMRAVVDQSQIKIGMPMDAVYIAWGKPSQVITEQTSDGKAITRWIYAGTTWEEYRYWNYHYYGYGRHGGAYPVPTLDYDYVPRSYVTAEVTFEEGVVKNWRNMTPPPPY